MANDDVAGHELVEKGHSAGPSSGPAVKAQQERVGFWKSLEKFIFGKSWGELGRVGRSWFWNGVLGGALVLGGTVLVMFFVMDMFRSGPPAKPQLKITDKVTFVIGNGDGDNLGYITIGVFGDILPVTRKNFISLAKGEVNGNEIDYGYKGSRLSNDEDYFITAGKFDGNKKGKAIYDGNLYFSGKFKTFTWEDLTKYNKENLTSCCLRKGYVAMLKNPLTEGDTGQAAFDSRFVIYKEDITWDDDDLKQNLIFGKVMGDEERVRETFEKLDGVGLLVKDIREEDIKENVDNENIVKPEPVGTPSGLK